MTRGLLVFLTLAILVAPLAAQAQPARKIPRIGVLEVGSPPSSPDWKQRSVFLQELRTLGWREGENLTIEYRWASGQFHRGDELAAELVHLHVDGHCQLHRTPRYSLNMAWPTRPMKAPLRVRRALSSCRLRGLWSCDAYVHAHHSRSTPPLAC